MSKARVLSLLSFLWRLALPIALGVYLSLWGMAHESPHPCRPLYPVSCEP